MARVLEVTSVEVSLIKTKPPQTHVVAHGTVPTSGWKHPELTPWFYVRAPEDGIQDFDFVADPPRGIVFEIITPVAAELTIPRDPIDYWGPGKPLRGVRIHASKNIKEATFDDVSQLKLAFSLLDHPIPWPWHFPTKPPFNSDLIGKSLRVYHTGDPLTKDFRPDRANIELSPTTELIVGVWFG